MSAVRCTVLKFTSTVIQCPDDQQFPIEPIPLEPDEGSGTGDGGGG